MVTKINVIKSKINSEDDIVGGEKFTYKGLITTRHVARNSKNNKQEIE